MISFDVVTPFTYNHQNEPKEMVIPGDNVRPDESMSIREILERFSRGVPVVGVNHTDFDDDPDAIMTEDYVFPDFPDFADYVFAEQRIERLRKEQAIAAAERASEAQRSKPNEASNGGGPAGS